MSEGIQLTEPRVSGATTPSKRKPAEGKDALLTGRTSAALDTKTSSPHKGDRAFCGCGSLGFPAMPLLLSSLDFSAVGRSVHARDYGLVALLKMKSGQVMFWKGECVEFYCAAACVGPPAASDAASHTHPSSQYWASSCSSWAPSCMAMRCAPL